MQLVAFYTLFWSQLGDITEVRLVKNQMGKSKGFAYIEFKNQVRGRQCCCALNPFTIEDDLHLISHYVITAESTIKLMRITKMIAKLEKFLIFNSTSPVTAIGNV